MSMGARIYGEYQHRAQAQQRTSAREVVAGLARRELEEYSIARGIRALVEEKPALAPMEFEIHRALQDAAGKQPAMMGLGGSLLIPTQLVMERDLTMASAAGGGYLVGQSQGPVIDALRARSVVMALGATVLPGLNGDVPLPKISTGASGYWLTNEGAQITESDPVTGQIMLTPKTAAGFIEISQSLLRHSNADIVFRRDLTKLIAASIDTAAINGSGASGEPTGVVNFSGVNAISGASLAWGGVLDFIVNAGTANAEVTGFATTAAVYKVLASREKFTGAGPIIQDGRIDGRLVVHSAAVPAAKLVAGPWEELWIGEWGTLELAVDPFTKFTQRLVGLRAMITVDIATRYPSSFSVASNIT